MNSLIKNNRKRQALLLTAYAVLFGILTVCGILFQDSRAGRWLIIIYGIYALIKGVKSADTFRMGFVCLLYTPLLAILGNSELVSSFTEYAFLLLFIGCISAFKEQWKEGSRQT